MYLEYLDKFKTVVKEQILSKKLTPVERRELFETVCIISESLPEIEIDIFEDFQKEFKDRINKIAFELKVKIEVEFDSKQESL